jgi:hypothetical protein
MEIHILNGDALTDRMQAAGFDNLIVCREALIDGPVDAFDMNEFWKMRTNFIEDNIEEARGKYFEYVVTEFEKLKEIPAGTTINLWFGDDLFCQANIWFLINYLEILGRAGSLYRVFPLIRNEAARWHEFGGLDPQEFRVSYQNRVALTRSDVALAENLWNAYATNNFKTLKSLAATPTNAFHDLDKVVQAHIDRFPEPGELGRPERILKEIMDSGVTDFSKLFPAFNNREGIYGFGDVQVKSILANLK